MLQQAVEVGIEGGIATVRLLRPASRNSMDRALVDGLRRALQELDADDEVRAIALTGSAPGFCAGSDLKYISRLDPLAMARFEQECGELGRLLSYLSKPVVAAVEGFAIGGGFTLATCCDLVVAGSGAKWHLPEVPHGWLTPWGLGGLVARAGLVRTRQLCFALEVLDSAAAKEIGVVDYLAPDGQALERAQALCAGLARLPAPAVRATKRFFSSYTGRDAEAMDYEANRLFLENCAAPEAAATLGRYRAKAPAQDNT